MMPTREATTSTFMRVLCTTVLPARSSGEAVAPHQVHELVRVWVAVDDGVGPDEGKPIVRLRRSARARSISTDAQRSTRPGRLYLLAARYFAKGLVAVPLVGGRRYARVIPCEGSRDLRGGSSSLVPAQAR